MKKCNTCAIQKSLDEFHKKSTSKDGYSNKCKQCQKEYQSTRYQNNKEKFIQLNYDRRQNLAQEVDKLKDHPCLDCGKQYEPFCMDFDHLRDKFMAISKMIHETFSLEKIKQEIAKCELVCVLCHKDRTYARLQEQEKKKLYPCYDRNREIIKLAKSQPCAICNIQYNYWQMEFDHIIEKDIAVGLMLGASQQKLEKEMAKCQILCALCHRRKTKKELW